MGSQPYCGLKTFIDQYLTQSHFLNIQMKPVLNIMVVFLHITTEVTWLNTDNLLKNEAVYFFETLVSTYLQIHTTLKKASDTCLHYLVTLKSHQVMALECGFLTPCRLSR